MEMDYSSLSPREHIERFRRDRFYIGREEKNPLAEDLSHACNYLSEELYSKDVHFLMELIQNAEDNKYPTDVIPSLEFVITSTDITATGANSTLLVFNNEIGFSPANIESICRIGKSTKKGSRHLGYIGEKGIGFKSVFLISSKPHIFSNGYQIKFNEEPSPECNIGYIVPEWVEDKPTVSDIQRIYGVHKNSLPTTVIILPLKSAKEQAVKQKLSTVHPEILLFLSKIRKLSVREVSDNPNSQNVNQISITSEANYQERKNISAESYTLHLEADVGNKNQEACIYYMWKQKFPVKAENRVSKRSEVDEWSITLAFPYGRRLNSGMISSGIYAFLPTDMVTGFPFIIQGDFLLASSREAILLDNPWNKGILDCVSTAFLNAFVTLLKESESAPYSSAAFLFKFLPVIKSSIPLLESVRLDIRDKIVMQHIMPCESYTEQKIFCLPSNAGRLIPAFWDILKKSRNSGIDLFNLHSHGSYVLNSFLDNEDFQHELDFLGVPHMADSWYKNFIKSSNLPRVFSQVFYLDLLCFIADNSRISFSDVPLLRYFDAKSPFSLMSVTLATSGTRKLFLSSDENYMSWMINWNQEFLSSSNALFMPPSTQKALNIYENRVKVNNWLQNVAQVQKVDVFDYASLVVRNLTERSHVIAFTHFLIQSGKYLSSLRIKELCSSLPLVDNYGSLISNWKKVLIPAKSSKWATLMGSNPWRNENCVELSTDYMVPANFFGTSTSATTILDFLRSNIGASDVPDICPPNAGFPTLNSPLTKDNSFLLLQWIQNLRDQGKKSLDNFFHCIQKGSWIKTSVGYRCPAESFLAGFKSQGVLQMASSLVDVPLIDKSFYGDYINQYADELKFIGVKDNLEELYKKIGNHLSIAAKSSLSREQFFDLLKFIRYLEQENMKHEHLIGTVQNHAWLKTSLGQRSPVGSILDPSYWKVPSTISSLPFIDASFYGQNIYSYKAELKVLGVLVSFDDNYEVVADNLKPLTSLISADAAFLLLECVRRKVVSSPDFITKVSGMNWLKTLVGHRTPKEALVVSPEWSCLLQVVDGLPFIDQSFYGEKLYSYYDELKVLGVRVCIDSVYSAIAHQLKVLLDSSSIALKNVFALLECRRQLQKTEFKFNYFIDNFGKDNKWLLTRLGFRSPEESILFNSEWESISSIARLPFIDASSTPDGYTDKIHQYKDELVSLGVVVKLEDGVKFVLSGLYIPEDPSVVIPVSVFSLLNCIRLFIKGNKGEKREKRDLPHKFISTLGKDWLRTSMGYQSPSASILFDSKWAQFLQIEDGPFLDEAFYVSDLTLYRDELKAIGVIVNVGDGCQLLARNMKFHSDISAISRIYKYLKANSFEVEFQGSNYIWIPNESSGGQWVSSESCIIHDENNFFHSRFHVLDRYYEKSLLGFFSSVLGVRHGPGVEDYCKLWVTWEATSSDLTNSQCTAFWEFISKKWNNQTEKLLSGSISKVPVCKGNQILLSNKVDVFIPDDLLIKDLLDTASEETIFIWYPRTFLPLLPMKKLNDIYRSIGIRTISEAVEMDELLFPPENHVHPADPSHDLLKKCLLRIVLAFLADPLLSIHPEERHQIVKILCGLTILETDKPIAVSFKVALSSGTLLVAKAEKMFRLEKETSKLFIQKKKKGAEGSKQRFECATDLADVISKTILFERTEMIPALSELLKLSCLLDFEEDAVEYLLKTKNLQLFVDDEEFLSSGCLNYGIVALD